MRRLGIGYQDFVELRKNNNFYIDKTSFIRDWWNYGDVVTLIARPRRFGKTLMMSTVETFFSTKHAEHKSLFADLEVWNHKDLQKLQGKYPVLFVSFADVKENTYQQARKKICRIIESIYNNYHFLLESNLLNKREKENFQHISIDMEDNELSYALKALSNYLFRYYGKKVILLLDEYDTPMQEAYVNGYWDELASLTRSLFNSTFKTNPYLERAIMTGITRISKESIFSDLNNLEVVTSTSAKYAESFGFTEDEVFAALDEFNLSDRKQEVKLWYDGFIFGKKKDIYNPWSILNYLDKRKLGTYWANSSSNDFVGKLIREGNPEIKIAMEELLQGKSFHTTFDEQIIFNTLDHGDEAVWSLLLASGYLKAEHTKFNPENGKTKYELTLTNQEIHATFQQMIEGWFSPCQRIQNAFLQAMLSGDIEGMNEYMNDISSELFSSFDTGKNPSAKAQPERFYHGFVLGMMVELRGQYRISSNKESGFGRYDIMLEPKNKQTDALIIEFKVVNTRRGEMLKDAVNAALKQIEDKKYVTLLLDRGIPKEKIKKYGFAFLGKQVLIGDKYLP